MLGGMQSTQIAVRLPADLLAELDRQIPRRFATRADAVRAGLIAVLGSESVEAREERHRRGWLEHPADDASTRAMVDEARALIADEPW